MKAILVNTVVVLCGLVSGALLVAVAGCDSDEGLVDIDNPLDVDQPLADASFGEPDAVSDEPLEVERVVPQQPVGVEGVVPLNRLDEDPIVVEDTSGDGVITADETFAAVAKEDEVEDTVADDAPIVGYDRANEITMHEAVLGKRLVKLEDGSTGVVVRLQPGGDFIEALIGTVGFLADHDIDVGIADRILITGPIVELEDGKRMLLARELTWGDHELELRDDEGEPHW